MTFCEKPTKKKKDTFFFILSKTTSEDSEGGRMHPITFKGICSEKSYFSYIQHTACIWWQTVIPSAVVCLNI